MKIGIDISQIVHEGTGVATYVRRMVAELLRIDKKNEYVLFGASFRKKDVFEEFYQELKKSSSNVTLVSVAIPPTLLDLLWNRLHISPVEQFIGPVDVFWSSDWTQPPMSAKGVTTIHDLSPLKFPNEMDGRIVKTHGRRLEWVKRECQAVFCDSEATKRDVFEMLHIPNDRLHVVYPGL